MKRALQLRMIGLPPNFGEIEGGRTTNNTGAQTSEAQPCFRSHVYINTTPCSSPSALSSPVSGSER
jgi:hypothetical protein